MATMRVEIVSAERRLFSGEASEVYARSLEGEIGILPGHQPALLALDVAPVVVRRDGGEDVFAVHRGFLFFRANRLVILADLAEHVDEIDPERAGRSLRRLSDATAEHDEEMREKLRRDRARLAALERRG